MALKTKEFGESLNKLDSLEKAAKNMKLELKQTGFFKEGEAAPGIEWLVSNPEMLSKLEQLKFSPPIEVGKSYYIMHIKDKKSSFAPEYKSIAQKVKEAFVNAEGQKLAEQKINQCAEELKKQNFNQAAKKSGLKIKETLPFKFGDKIKELKSSDIFWENAKSLKSQENSKIIKLAEGFYIIKVKSLSARDEKKFDKEKSQYSQKILEQKQDERFNKFMEELKNKAR